MKNVTQCICYSCYSYLNSYFSWCKKPLLWNKCNYSYFEPMQQCKEKKKAAALVESNYLYTKFQLTLH